MARLARDNVQHYTSDVLHITLNGVVVVPNAVNTLAAGSRAAELAVNVVSGRSLIAPKADSGPQTFKWLFSPLAGCDDAELTAPDHPTTRLQTLNPGDHALITLKVAGKFEEQVVTFDLAVPA